jgi:hypothetical protein
MLAARDRREICDNEADLSRLRARIPRSAFTAAYKELCTRIWMELQTLAQAADQVDSSPSQHLLMSTAILRLELVVLLDSYRSERWRRMLSTEQRDRMCSMLADLLATLYVDPEHLSTGITEAECIVFDELRAEAEAGPCQLLMLA